MLLTLLALIFAMLVGLVFALCNVSRNKALNVIGTVYVDAVRGVPLIVLAFFIYFGIPYAINNYPEGTTAKARELLQAAGYVFGEDGKLSAETPIKIEYLTNESSGHIAVAESMQQDFAALGIDMSIQVQDWNVFLEERKNGNFDIAREGWIADFNDPINMLEMWTTESGNNDCQYGR